jgi:hypothetical protein
MNVSPGWSSTGSNRFSSSPRSSGGSAVNSSDVRITFASSRLRACWASTSASRGSLVAASSTAWVGISSSHASLTVVTRAVRVLPETSAISPKNPPDTSSPSTVPSRLTSARPRASQYSAVAG